LQCLPKAGVERKKSRYLGWNEPEMEGIIIISGERFLNWALFDHKSEGKEVKKVS
jgi:hypothetical protein